MKKLVIIAVAALTVATFTGCSTSRGTTGAGRIGNNLRTVGDGFKMMFKGETTVDVANNGTRRVLAEDGKSVLVALNPLNRMEGEAPFVVPDGSPTAYFVPEDGKLKQVPQRGNAFQLPLWAPNVAEVTWYRGVVSKTAYVVPVTKSPAVSSVAPDNNTIAQIR